MTSLETLTNEYDAVLLQYNKAKADISRNQIIKGQQVIGGQSLGETDAKSAEDCSAICAANEKCTGATFRSTNSKCATYSGVNLYAGPSENVEDYAIYNANLKLTKSLNKKLNELNRKIKDLVKEKGVKGEKINIDDAEKELKLEEELLDVELHKRDDMSSSIQETTIQTTMNQYWYWILIAGIVILIGALIYIFYFTKKIGPSLPSRYSSTTSSPWNRPSTSSSTSSSSPWNSSSSSRSSSPWNSSSSYSPWNSSSSYNPMKRGGGLFKEGNLKYQALIPMAVIFAATIVASQLQRFTPFKI